MASEAAIAAIAPVAIEISWNVPYTPSPIDFGRRRQHTLYIKKLQSTMPLKRSLYIMDKTRIHNLATASVSGSQRQ